MGWGGVRSLEEGYCLNKLMQCSGHGSKGVACDQSGQSRELSELRKSIKFHFVELQSIKSYYQKPLLPHTIAIALRITGSDTDNNNIQKSISGVIVLILGP